MSPKWSSDEIKAWQSRPLDEVIRSSTSTGSVGIGDNGVITTKVACSPSAWTSRAANAPWAARSKIARAPNSGRRSSSTCATAETRHPHRLLRQLDRPARRDPLDFTPIPWCKPESFMSSGMRCSSCWLFFKDRREVATAMHAIYTAPTVDRAQVGASSRSWISDSAPSTRARLMSGTTPGPNSSRSSTIRWSYPRSSTPPRCHRVDKSPVAQNRREPTAISPEQGRRGEVLVYLGLRNVSSERGGYSGTGTPNWTVALNTLSRLFPGRIPLC